MTASTSLSDNITVKELLEVLKENGKDTAGLHALLSYVKDMENYVKSAEDQISDMKSQIGEIKEIQKHLGRIPEQATQSPTRAVKTALNNAAESLEAKVTGIKTQLSKICNGIIEGCKNALTAVKETGVTALDKLANFFHIKQGFEAIQKDTTTGMNRCDKSIANIENFAKEYHQAGRSILNMARMLIGKDPIATPKEMGVLAKAMCVPYKAEKKCLNAIHSAAGKAISKLEELSKDANEIRQERKGINAEDRIAAYEAKAEKLNTAKSDKVLDPKPLEHDGAAI